jgi:hypothetical protein
VPRSGKKKPATIVDVASKAGVSLGTASRVMNNRRGVDPELRRKVTEAARSLQYVRAANARRALRENCPIVTFVLSNRDFLHPVHARLLQGAEEFCEERGFFVVFKRLDYSFDAPVCELKLPALLREHGIADCLILAGTNHLNLLDATERAGVPYVLYGNNLVGRAPHGPVDLVRGRGGPRTAGADSESLAGHCAQRVRVRGSALAARIADQRHLRGWRRRGGGGMGATAAERAAGTGRRIPGGL